MDKLHFFIFWLKNRNKQFRDTMSVPAYCIVPSSFKSSWNNYVKLSTNSINEVKIDGMKWIDWRLKH